MSKEQDIQQLSKHFRELGAPHPESWARSQIEEGIPQYARFVFLRQMWQNVIADGDTSWIEQEIRMAERKPCDPGAGIGPALKRMLAAGADRKDIAEVVRVMQWQTLAQIAYQLDDPGIVQYPSKATPRVNWTLLEFDDNGNPLHPIYALHESVLDTDPSDREMRPKGVTREG